MRVLFGVRDRCANTQAHLNKSKHVTAPHAPLARHKRGLILWERDLQGLTYKKKRGLMVWERDLLKCIEIAASVLA